MIEYYKIYPQMDYILFTYSLSFVLLATISFFLHKVQKEVELWKWLAGFGALRAIAVGIYFFYTFSSYKRVLLPFYLLFFISSLLCILEFVRIEIQKKYNSKLLGRWIFILVLAVVFSGYFVNGFLGVLLFSRYLLGFSLGLLAFAIALYEHYREKEYQRSKSPLFIIAGALFFIYLISQVVVLRDSFFPASFINEDVFLNTFGFPVTLVRAITVTLGSVFFWLYLYTLPIYSGVRSHKYFVPVSYLLILTIGWVSTQKTGKETQRNEDQLLLAKTKTAAIAISPSKIRGLTGSLKDLGNPNYETLRGQLIQIAKANPDCSFVHLLGVKNGNVFFLADAEPSESKDAAEPGENLNDYPPAILNSFASGEDAIIGPYTDKWGSWISAFVPIRDEQNDRVLAIMAMDIKASTTSEHIFKHRAENIVVVLVFFLLMLIPFILTQIRKMNSLKLAELEDKFAKVFYYNPVASGITRLEDGKIIDVNMQFESLFGYKKEEVIGKTSLGLQLYVDPNDRKKIIQQISEKGASRNLNIKFNTKYGHIITTLFSSVPLIINGESCLISAAENITHQKKTELALRDSEERLRSILENINIGVYLMDSNMRMLAVNRKVREMLPSCEFGDHPVCYETFNTPPRHKACMLCPAVQTLKDCKTHESVVDIQRDKLTLKYKVISSPVMDESGKLAYVVAIVEDVTGK